MNVALLHRKFDDELLELQLADRRCDQVGDALFFIFERLNLLCNISYLVAYVSALVFGGSWLSAKRIESVRHSKIPFEPTALTGQPRESFPYFELPARRRRVRPTKRQCVRGSFGKYRRPLRIPKV